MDIDALRLFIEVARLGSYAGAARQAQLDPSAVSRRISALETEIGIRLFNRTTRHLSLTDAGNTYLARVAPLVEELGMAQDEALSIHTRPAGTLRLTASVAFGNVKLVPLLDAFHQAFPDLKVDLLLTDENLDLVANRIDLALRLGPAVTGDVIASRLMDTRYRVCASPDFIDRWGAPRVPDDLEGLRCIVFTLPEFRTDWTFRGPNGDTTVVPVSSGLAISNALAIRTAALAGQGAALLADWLIGPDFADGRLVDMFPGHDVTATSFKTGVWFVYPSRSFLPGKVKAAIEFFRPRLRNPSG